eukprot:796069-Prymnesium_polylepis.2
MHDTGVSAEDRAQTGRQSTRAQSAELIAVEDAHRPSHLTPTGRRIARGQPDDQPRKVANVHDGRTNVQRSVP